MVVYVLYFIPLFKFTQEEEVGVLHPWYVNDMDMMVLVWRRARLLVMIKEKGPFYGHILDSKKNCYLCQNK